MELAKAITGTYLSEVFGSEEPTASLMSASPTRTPSLIANGLQPKSWKHTKKRRNVSTLGHVSSNDNTSHLLSVPWTGMLGREATTFFKRLAAKLATKWQRPYSAVCGYVNARLSIVIVRATHLCLRGSRRAQNQCPSSSMGRRSWFSAFSLLNYHLHNAGVLIFWIASRLLLSFSLQIDKRLNQSYQFVP
jgi:hypothetical protein